MRQILNTLYIMTEDTKINLVNENVSVLIHDIEKVRIPGQTIESIVCFGNATISTPLIGYCAKAGIEITFLSETGRFIGRIIGPTSGNILLRQRLFAAISDPNQVARYTRNITLGKLANTLRFLKRQKREREYNAKICRAIDIISQCIRDLHDAISADEMRGIEGVAASAYFAAFPEIIASSALQFHGRSKHPPEDGVNALLSFLYALIRNDVTAALEQVGLDPAAGFSHTLRPGRQSLSLDMMEELRIPLGDKLAVSMLNLGQINEAHFDSLDTPAYLGDKGRRLVVERYQKRKLEIIQHPFIQEKMQLGLVPFIQARILAEAIRGGIDDYVPYCPDQ